ncbi:MAG TPA: M50 family metallopeptidase [Gammaproteobacteria bacterium]
MADNRYRSESFSWLATAYHEAGHAVVILLLGRTLLWVELTSHSTGAAWRESIEARLAQLADEASRRGRMPPELLRLWREEFWISDAGAIAEAEFNLVPDDALVNGALGDELRKFSLIPDEDRHAFVRDYFHRHLGRWCDLIKEDCRQFFRLRHVSAMTRTLAEALLRTRRMDGEEVIDTLLANRATLTGQMDLFWVPIGDNPFAHRRNHPPPKQMRLL